MISATYEEDGAACQIPEKSSRLRKTPNGASQMPADLCPNIDLSFSAATLAAAAGKIRYFSIV
jgi:hypothetical protein